MIYRLGQIREAQLEWPAAMNEYQRVSALFHKVKGKSDVKAKVEEALARLRPRVCKVVVRQKLRHRCVEDIVWVGPGKQTLKVGGKLEQIQAQAQAELQVGTCQ